MHWWDDLVSKEYQSTPVLASAYLYDPVLGLKTDANFSQKAPSSNDWVGYAKQQYAYDPQLDYLTSASYDDDGNGTWEATHTWTYDAAGNRQTASAQPGTWSYDNLNRMTQSPMGPYENDIPGNRLWQNHFQQGGRRMEWDALNRMASACTQSGGARYEYRADGMRTLKVEGLSLVWQEMDSAEKDLAGSGYYDAVWSTNKPTTRYFYPSGPHPVRCAHGPPPSASLQGEGQMPIEDDFTRTVSGQVLVDVTRNGLGAHGIDVMEKTTASATVTAFPVYDGHGNMVATLSRSGPGFAVNDRRSYDAWGAVRTGSATGDPKGRYVANLGHMQDDESGLVYMRARYYEALSGRFVSEDPARHGLNCFSYCSNDPISFSDSSGLFPWFSFIRLLTGGVGVALCAFALYGVFVSYSPAAVQRCIVAAVIGMALAGGALDSRLDPDTGILFTLGSLALGELFTAAARSIGPKYAGDIALMIGEASVGTKLLGGVVVGLALAYAMTCYVVLIQMENE